LGDKAALTLKGATLEARVIEGDEETEYWKKSLQKQAAGRNQKNSYKRSGGGGRGHGNNRNKRMRKGSNKNDDDGDDDGHEAENGDREKVNA